MNKCHPECKCGSAQHQSSEDDNESVKKPVSLLIPKSPVLNVAVDKPRWQPITMMVDSGASDTVMHPKEIPNAELVPSAGSKVGLEYEVANGQAIHNLGEKKLSVIPHGSQTLKGMTVQCAEVHRSLLSVAQCVDHNNMVVFDTEGSYILDKATGECTPLVREGNVFNRRVWAKPADTSGNGNQGFQRQGKP